MNFICFLYFNRLNLMDFVPWKRFMTFLNVSRVYFMAFKIVAVDFQRFSTPKPCFLPATSRLSAQPKLCIRHVKEFQIK